MADLSFLSFGIIVTFVHRHGFTDLDDVETLVPEEFDVSDTIARACQGSAAPQIGTSSSHIRLDKQHTCKRKQKDNVRSVKRDNWRSVTINRA